MRPTASTVAPPAGWKPVEVFTKSAPAASAAPARGDDAARSSSGRLDDDLEQRRGLEHGADGDELVLDGRPVALGGPAEVDHDVDLGGAVGDGRGGLGGLGAGLVRARREAAHRGDGHLRRQRTGRKREA